MIRAKDLFVVATDGCVECADGRCPCNGDLLAGSAPWTVAGLLRSIREHLSDARSYSYPSLALSDAIEALNASDLVPPGFTVSFNADPILERKTDDPIHPRPVE
jgi:hypothetical protein